MKVTLITSIPPAKDNREQPNAILWHMIKNSPPEIRFDLFYMQGYEQYREQIRNEIAQLDLDHCQEIPQLSPLGQKYQKVATKMKGLPEGVGVFPPDSDLVKQVNSTNPDCVWLFPLWMIEWVPKIECKKIVVTAPDSVSLHFDRTIRFGNEWTHADTLENKVRLLRLNERLEKRWSEHQQVLFHFVGREDLLRFRYNSGLPDAGFFVRHPIYECKQKERGFSNERVKVLFSSGYRQVYNGDHTTRVIDSLVQCDGLRGKCEFHFLGTGFEKYVDVMKKAGFSVTEKKWVNDYPEELRQFDVQIFPIAVGTGTKGKVLQSLGTGILSIGSEMAFENIDVKAGTECVIYHRPEDVSGMLLDIVNNREKYFEMPMKAAKKVSELHSCKRTTNEFWSEVFPEEIEKPPAFSEEKT